MIDEMRLSFWREALAQNGGITNFLDTVGNVDEFNELKAFRDANFPGVFPDEAFEYYHATICRFIDPAQKLGDAFSQTFPHIAGRLTTNAAKICFLRGAEFANSDPYFYAKTLENIFVRLESEAFVIYPLRDINIDWPESPEKNQRCYVLATVAKYTQAPPNSVRKLLLQGIGSCVMAGYKQGPSSHQVIFYPRTNFLSKRISGLLKVTLLNVGEVVIDSRFYPDMTLGDYVYDAKTKLIPNHVLARYNIIHSYNESVRELVVEKSEDFYSQPARDGIVEFDGENYDLPYLSDGGSPQSLGDQIISLCKNVTGHYTSNCSDIEVICVKPNGDLAIRTIKDDRYYLRK